MRLLLLSLFISTASYAKTPQFYINKYCVEYDINCHIVKAILTQESQLKVNAVNHKSKDYGIGQLNIKIINAYGLNKQLLLSDVKYSVDMSMRQLKWFKDRYKHKEPATWWCRYNVGTAKFHKIEKRCNKYIKAVSRYLPTKK